MTKPRDGGASPAARFFVVMAATRCCYVTAKLSSSIAFPGSSQDRSPPLAWLLKGDLRPADRSVRLQLVDGGGTCFL